MAHIVSLVPEFQWNKRIESTGFVLQISESFHMIDAVTVIFYMAIKHGRIGMHSKHMGHPVNIQPALGIYFIFTNLFSDLCIEDLCTTTGA